MKKLMLVSILSLCISISANASFVDESSSNPFFPNPQFKVIGNSHASVIHGFGNDVPLASAIRQIVPESYQVTVTSHVQQNVSWIGAQTWTEVLSTLSRSLDRAYIVVDHVAKHVRVHPDSRIGPDPINNSDVQTAELGKNGPASSIEVKSIEPTEIQAPPREILTFDMPAGSQFHTALDSFLQSHGWDLVWVDNENFKVMASVQLSGTIDSIVEQLIDAVSRSTGNSYYATLYEGNRVVRIHR